MSSKKSIVKQDAPGAITAATAYGDDIGGGFEDFSSEDFAIPFINVLQKMSPSVDEDNGAYIKGAKAGMLVNNVTSRLHDGKVGIRFIPVHRTHEFIEWIPRDQGGGFVASHVATDPIVQAARAEGGDYGKLSTPDGNDLVETFSVYGLLVNDDGSYDQVIISLSSSQIKPYKRWMTTAMSITLRDEATGRRFPAPLWAHVYRIRTQYQENASGSWYNYNITLDGETAEACRLAPDSELYVAAKNFRSLITSGAIQVKREAGSSSMEADDDAF